MNNELSPTPERSTSPGIVLIDNYDSFTYNLYHLLRLMSGKVQVYRNNGFKIADLLAEKPRALVISPGPGRPKDAGLCLELIHASAGQVPIFGVCLGHQALAEATGVPIVHAPELVHGKTSLIHHTDSPLFADVPTPFHATRYHSLMVDAERIRNSWKVTAETENGIVMAIEHPNLPWAGVQFHPESVLTKWGPKIVANFLRHFAGIRVTEPPLYSVTSLGDDVP